LLAEAVARVLLQMLVVAVAAVVLGRHLVLL